jgi:hypothetical protein
MRSYDQNHSFLRSIIAATLATAALGLPATVLAQNAPSATEQALAARVAELEKQVQALLAAQKAAPPAAAPAATVAAAPAAAPGKPAPAPIQQTSITPNAAPNTTFLLTGFVKVDGLFTNTSHGEIPDNSSGRDYYIPGVTPVTGVDEGTDLNAHPKQSRLNFGTDTILAGGDKLSTRFEIDFYGSTTADQRVSNSWAPALRHAYVTWREWLVGQTWSNFMDPATLPEAADFIGPTDGTTFVRQPQVRWTKGGLSLSAENRETTITPYTGVGTTYTATTAARITSDDGMTPDLTARYAFKGDWGHIAIAGLLRELVYETTASAPTVNGVAGRIDASTWSGSVSLSGKLNFGKDDVRWMLLYGDLGRYVGLNFANDAILNSSGDLDAIDGWAGFVAYRHLWTDKLRSTFQYSLQDYDNDTSLSGSTDGWTPNKASDSWSVNLFYTPIPKLDIGAEYRFATREVENGEEGDLNRLQLTTKYSF